MNVKWSLALVVLVTIVILAACDRDIVAPAQGCDNLITRYQSSEPGIVTVKDIIDQTCAYEGCHVSGSGIGNYTAYQGMVGSLENGDIADRVITQKDNPVSGMPPDMSVYPHSRQDSLSPIQLEIITCWLQEGFPE